MGWNFPAVAEDLSLADDAGGLPSAARVSEPLRAAAGADPLIDVEAAPSANLRGHVGPSGFNASRGSDEDGSQFDIVTVPELIVCPDAGGGGGGRRFASGCQPVWSTGEPSDLDDDLHRGWHRYPTRSMCGGA